MASDTRFTDGFDEAFADGAPRPEYAPVLGRLEHLGLLEVRARVAERLADRGVVFGAREAGTPFVVDPVPRLIPRADWTPLRAGIAQRTRALEAFVHDAYGPRRCVAEGIVPDTAIDTAEGYEPALRGRLPGATTIGVAGLDVVRDEDGSFVVLEDNVRTPSGFAYAAAAREALQDEIEPPEANFGIAAFAGLGEAIRAAAPPGVADPLAVILTDGPGNSAHYEHEVAARHLGLPLVTPEQVERHGGELILTDPDAGWRRVDIVYRRTDEDRAFDAEGAPTPIGALLAGPWLDGRLGLVNGYGTGLADDKAIHAHIEDLVRLYLGEEPLLASVHTYDLTDPACLAEALERIDELVVKPRVGHGGHGIVVCAHATKEDVARAAAAIRAEPARWVAQPTIALSRHPTVTDEGTLGLRHVDLRPFAFSGGWPEDPWVVVPPGGLTRVALAEGSLVVNSSQRGGGKDTWVIP